MEHDLEMTKKARALADDPTFQISPDYNSSIIRNFANDINNGRRNEYEASEKLLQRMIDQQRRRESRRGGKRRRSSRRRGKTRRH